MNNLFLLAILSILTSCTTIKKQNHDSTSIQLIRNATLKINYNGQTLLVDPSLSPKNSFMSFVTPNKNLNPTVDLSTPIHEITNGLDAILITHTHLDHFDEGAKKHLDPTLPLFGQPFDQKALADSPFRHVTIIEEKAHFEGITINRTTGKHGPEHMIENLGEVSGFVLQAPQQPTIYIVGDCLWNKDIKNAISQYQPDIIVVNSGGAQWGGENILMDENQVIELAEFAPKAKIVAVHMEALDHCMTTRKILQEKVNSAKVDVVIPQDGEYLQF